MSNYTNTLLSQYYTKGQMDVNIVKRMLGELGEDQMKDLRRKVTLLEYEKGLDLYHRIEDKLQVGLLVIESLQEILASEETTSS